MMRELHKNVEEKPFSKKLCSKNSMFQQSSTEYCFRQICRKNGTVSLRIAHCELFLFSVSVTNFLAEWSSGGLRFTTALRSSQGIQDLLWLNLER